EHPLLFVETREHEGRQAPAYYLAARWLLGTEGCARILPADALPGVYRFDARWWSEARRVHGRGDPPLITLWRGEQDHKIPCPRCDGRLHLEPAVVGRDGWAPALHAMPLGPQCALRAHLVLDAARLPLPVDDPGRLELEEGIEDRVPAEQVWRLADRVPEPDDHLHER
ncbi:MAG: hypothetical protein KC468_30580, partial [Myxococcales bacterium]|nr:hypothetical protein [Myxococcales bacterium]